MSRYLGPKHKHCRREGIRLCDSPKCPVLRRNYPPGVHGPKGAPRMTPYGEQLREKQKAKRIYLLTERQFHNYYKKSMKLKGDTGAFLLGMLEKRLDNVVYRLGFARTRSQARQMVSHGFFTVNDKPVNIPSFQVSTSDVIAIKGTKIKKKLFEDFDKRIQKQEFPTWVHFDGKTQSAKIISDPIAKELKPIFEVKSIVEFYSR